jgi:hypothetical protein
MIMSAGISGDGSHTRCPVAARNSARACRMATRGVLQRGVGVRVMDRLIQRVALAGAEGRGLPDGPFRERGVVGQGAFHPANASMTNAVYPNPPPSNGT